MQKTTKKSGLPDSLSMRHDIHFVDFISSRRAGPHIRMIPISKIDPNPRQARNELGDITELMASIKEKGVLEPILVRPLEGRYEIIAGERRYVASKRLGLSEIACIEMEVEENEAMELALIENLQRKNLDVFEESEGLSALVEIYNYSHQDIAKKIGKARSTITEILNICRIPSKIRQLCKNNNVMSRSILIEISKIKTEEEMFKFVRQIIERELKREDTRELSKLIAGKERKPRYFTYNYKPKNSEEFRLKIEFKKSEVKKEEIIKILEEIIEKLKSK